MSVFVVLRVAVLLLTNSAFVAAGCSFIGFFS